METVEEAAENFNMPDATKPISRKYAEGAKKYLMEVLLINERRRSSSVLIRRLKGSNDQYDF